MRMPFGKYRGEPLEDIPQRYLLWVLDNCHDLSPTLRRTIEDVLDIQNEIRPRGVPALPMVVIDPWYRQLAREFHPDARGGPLGMVAGDRAMGLLIALTGGRS